MVSEHQSAENSSLWNFKGSIAAMGTAVPNGIPQISSPGELCQSASSAACSHQQKGKGCIHELTYDAQTALPRKKILGTEGPTIKSRYKDKKTDNYSQYRHSVAWGNFSNKETEENIPTLQQRGLD